MTPDRFGRVQRLFENALERPSEERDAFLREACGRDDALRAEVEGLLAADARDDALLDDEPPAPTSMTASTALQDFEREATLPIGTKLGEYELEEKIGAGGLGTVYRAVHPVIRKTAAIKILRPDLSASARHANRFVTEARAVNKILHPDIVDVFGFGETDDGGLYYIMEHMDAPTLAEVLRERGRLPLSEPMPILRGLAAALEAAHDKGVVHRDLEPANIMIYRDAHGTPVPKLLDFGIAKLVDPSPTLAEIERARPPPQMEFDWPDEADVDPAFGSA